MEWLKELIEKHTKDGVLDQDALMKNVKETFPKYAVPKEDFNTVNEAKKTLEQDIKTRDKQIQDLKAAAGDAEKLNQKIAETEAANKQMKADYEAKIREMTLDSAIRQKLTDTKYPDLLSGKFDRSKLVINADGTVTGIDEQLGAIKESYKDLFIPAATGKDPRNQGQAGAATGRRQELEKVIADTALPLPQRIAARNELESMKEE